MSKCYNCGTEFTLKSEETHCDSCKKVVNFPCHNCKQWFSVYDEETKTKRDECKACGFFICPHCGMCGSDCIKDRWQTRINQILAPEITYSNTPCLQKKINKLLKFIEDIKLNREQRSCIRDVPISYAKGRIKSALVRMRGYRTKDNEDMKKFIARLEEVTDKNIGEVLTINNSREKGSYGQEYRDAFNMAICYGKLQIEKITKSIDGEDVEITVYKRVEKGYCPHLNVKDLITKWCSKCKTIYDVDKYYCPKEECKLKKGKRKGQQPILKLKISNKDICQLNRGDFTKDGEMECP